MILFYLASAKHGKISARLGLASWMKRQTCCIGRVQELSHQCWIPFLSQRCHHLHTSLDGRRKSCDPRVPTATNVTFPIRIHEACVCARVERRPHGIRDRPATVASPSLRLHRSMETRSRARFPRPAAHDAGYLCAALVHDAQRALAPWWERWSIRACRHPDLTRTY